MKTNTDTQNATAQQKLTVKPVRKRKKQARKPRKPVVWHAEDSECNGEMTFECKSGYDAAWHYINDDLGFWRGGGLTESLFMTVDVWQEKDGERVKEDRHSILLTPPMPECVDEREHDWQSPKIVGRPSLVRRNDKCVHAECCVNCGCARYTDYNASNPDTREGCLTSVDYEAGKYAKDIMAKDDDEDDLPASDGRIEAAREQNAWPSTAVIEKEERYVDFRYTEARNSREPEILIWAIRDTNSHIRCGAAGNSTASLEVLEAAIVDRYVDVRVAAARHLNSSPSILEAAILDTNVDVRYAAARNPNAPLGVLEAAIRDTLSHVRCGAVRNPNMPALMLENALADEYEDVRQAAEKAINAKRLLLAEIPTVKTLEAEAGD